MVNGLAAIFSGVDDGAIALRQSLLAGDLRYDPEQMAEQRSVFGRRFGERTEVLARDNQHMDRGVGMNVGEGDALLVLVDASGGDASVDDLAEEAGHNSNSIGDTLAPIFERTVAFALEPMDYSARRKLRGFEWKDGRRSRKR